MQIARCQEIHERLVAARAALEHERELEDLLDRRVEAHVAAIGHVPLRHSHPPRTPPPRVSR